jgi:tetratricopeptide (TPR) repeat protein
MGPEPSEDTPSATMPSEEEPGRPEEAEQAYRQAIDSGHPDLAPMASYNLGLLLSEQGRPKEAEEAFELAISSGTSEEVVRAAQQALQQLRTRGDS